MNPIKYIKERWLTYSFILAVSLFAFIVYKLDSRFAISPSSASYVAFFILLMLIVFIITDYRILKKRIEHYRDYCRTNAMNDDADTFSYPLDAEYAACAYRIASEYEKYKSDIRTNSAQEMEFITRWVHDAKVPISAMRLMLENHEHELPEGLYGKMDMEITRMEDDTQTILYNMKSHSFSDDYRLGEVGTNLLITQALKSYLNIINYKHISIELPQQDFTVLTDEKWSAYILSQIFSNACKYTPEDGRIIIDAVREGPLTSISVQNTGSGISPADIGNIFGRGYTSVSERGKGKATGYGLYLAWKLADKLGHRLTAESQFGQYARFTLIFTDNSGKLHITKS